MDFSHVVPLAVVEVPRPQVGIIGEVGVTGSALRRKCVGVCDSALEHDALTGRTLRACRSLDALWPSRTQGSLETSRTCWTSGPVHPVGPGRAHRPSGPTVACVSLGACRPSGDSQDHGLDAIVLGVHVPVGLGNGVLGVIRRDVLVLALTGLRVEVALGLLECH